MSELFKLCIGLFAWLGQFFLHTRGARGQADRAVWEHVPVSTNPPALVLGPDAPELEQRRPIG